jgi:NTP pyrophosphatase (non-canonical NTP hydrolase)
MTTMKTNGTIDRGENIPLKTTATLAELFDEQIFFQRKINKGANIPEDNVDLFQYHMLALSEEIGEVLKADKRWKTHRNDRFVVDEKLDELADCFITLINIACYSGFGADVMSTAILDKIKKNIERVTSNVKK